MSSAQRATWNVVCQYGQCQERGAKHEFDGRYCSREHRLRDAAADVLGAIRRDHRVCASCYRVLKHVEEPPEYYQRKWSQVIKEAVVGFEHPTQDLHESGGHRYCTCSNVDSRADIGFLKVSDLRGTIANLLAVMAQYREEGDKPDAVADVDELLAALKEQSTEGPLDWELALGRAIEA